MLAIQSILKTCLNCYFSIMKTLFSTTAILLFAVFNASAQQKNYREIWVFSKNAGNTSFITQKSILANAAGLKERDIRVHEISGLKVNESIFRKYEASAQTFTFILFGKDGGEKLRSREPVSLEKLYQTIDAMPMRKNEMKSRF